MYAGLPCPLRFSLHCAAVCPTCSRIRQFLLCQKDRQANNRREVWSYPSKAAGKTETNEMQARRQITFVTREVLQRAMTDMQRVSETRKPHATIPQRITRPRLIKILSRQIRTMFKQGYDVEDVVALLGQHGIEIDTQAFRRYWGQAKRGSKRSLDQKQIQKQRCE